MKGYKVKIGISPFLMLPAVLSHFLELTTSNLLLGSLVEVSRHLQLLFFFINIITVYMISYLSFLT